MFKSFKSWRLAAAAGLLLAGGSQALAIPSTLAVQGYLTNASGAPQSGDFTITVSLWSAETGGSELYSQTLTGVVVQQGLFDAMLGLDPLYPGLNAGIFRNNPNVWLQIELDAGPGVPTNEAPLPRRPMSTAPWAFASHYADLAANAEQAQVARDLNCTSCVSVSELDFDPVTQAELTSALSDVVRVSDLAAALSNLVSQSHLESVLNAYALKSEIPTSIHGMAGGTVTSAVSVTGSVTASSFTQNGNQVCDSSGNCGATLGALTGCQNFQVPRFNNGNWECFTPSGGGSGGSAPTVSCTGANQALQWDGNDFVCRDLNTTGLSGGKFNGYEVRDEWGFAWDGIARGAKSWQQANQICEAAGARLPTASELYRNNALNGTGNLADSNVVQPHWTRTQSYSSTVDAPRYVTVKLNDGVTAVSDATANVQFRCVWPDSAPKDFSGDNCYGKPGESCKSQGFAWHVDTADRPKLDWTAAQNECRFYNATLPDTQSIFNLVHDSWAATTLTGSTREYIWSSSIWYSSSTLYAHHYRWDRAPEPFFTDNASGSFAAWQALTGAATTGHFRCIGKKDENLGHLPEPECYGGECVSLSQRGARLLADNADRPAANHLTAQNTCHAAGGSLPSITEFQDLIADGWGVGSNVHLWTNQFNANGTTGWSFVTAAWSGNADSSRWWLGGPAALMSQHGLGATVTRPYRCVYREHLEPTFRNCASNQVQTWNAQTQTFSCQPSVAGDSAGRGFPGGNKISDRWGADWDSSARVATTYTTAAQTCENLGARLPTATELYRVSQNSGTTNILGAEFRLFNANEVHWTLNPVGAVTVPTRVTLNTSNGVSATLAETSSTPFRCIWPATHSDAFTGTACHGNPSDTANGGCFVANGVRVDDYDRAKLRWESAAWECNYFGGRIASWEDATKVVRAGAPNGTNSQIWSSNGFYAHSRGGLATVSWNGTGAATWQLPGSVAAANAAHSTLLGFRCAFNDELTR